MNERQPFGDWLLNQVHRNDPVGWFADDVASDIDMSGGNPPMHDDDVEAWEQYLTGAPDDVIEAMKTAIKEYLEKKEESDAEKTAGV